MKQNELIDKLCEFARVKMSTKAKTAPVQFLFGFGSVGLGRKMIENKVAPLLQYCADSNGDIDVSGLRESVSCGFSAAKSIPVLGGMISLDKEDADEFFSFIGVQQSQQTATPPQQPQQPQQ